ncbi:MAG: OmpA family protein [Polyangiales bacterium]
MRRSFVIVVTTVGCAATSAPSSPSTPAPASASAPAVAPAFASASASASADASASASASASAPKYVVVATSNPPIVELVTFEKGSAKVRPEAKPLLDEIAAVMAGHPEIELLQIEGHSVAGEATTVSQARADAVRDALVTRGIAKARLRAKGFAAYCPRFPNPDARNRRTELKVAKMNGAPRDALGCDAATAAGIVSDPVP